MTSGPRAIAVGLVLHPTNLVQPLMSGPADAGPGGRAGDRSDRPQLLRTAGPPDRDVLRTLAPKAIALYEQLREALPEAVQGDLSREEPS